MGGLTLSANGTLSGTILSTAGGHTLTLHVMVTDADGNEAHGVFYLPVLDGLAVSAGPPITATEGTSFTGTIATLSDTASSLTASDFSATVHWGDGTSTTGGVSATGTGTFNVAGSHSYSDEGSYSVTVTVTEATGGTGATGSAGFDATVADARLSASPVSASATAGSAFAGTVATFTDANTGAPVSDYSTTIEWGDGSRSAGTVSSTGTGSFAVSGTHTYSSPGAYSAAVSVDDVGGSSATATSTVTCRYVEASPHHHYR